jgi:hypothetical protein
MIKMVLLGSLCFALTVHAEEELLSAKDIFTEEATMPSETDDSNTSKKKSKSAQPKKPKADEENASSPSMLKPKGAKDPFESP